MWCFHAFDPTTSARLGSQGADFTPRKGKGGLDIHTQPHGTDLDVEALDGQISEAQTLDLDMEDADGECSVVAGRCIGPGMWNAPHDSMVGPEPRIVRPKLACHIAQHLQLVASAAALTTGEIRVYDLSATNRSTRERCA